MNLLVTFLICAAILTSVFTVGVLILWLKGVDAIALPGFGLIFATPLIVLLLLLVDMVLVILAVFGRSVSANA